MHSSAPAPTGQEAQTIARVLQGGHTVAVVGCSPKPERDSHIVARYLQAQGWRVIPVNPMVHSVLGETCYPDLASAAQAHTIDVVDVFRNAADVPPIAEHAIAIGARVLWLQLGVVHEAAAAQARAAGLLVVQDRCLKVEHARAAGHEDGTATMPP